MDGAEAWNNIVNTLQSQYRCVGKDAGYEGRRIEVIVNRKYPDTSSYLTISGDCPTRYAEEHDEQLDHQCAVTVRLSDHRPSFSLKYDLRYEDEGNNEATMKACIKYVRENLDPFDEKKDTQRREAAEHAAVVKRADAVLAAEWDDLLESKVHDVLFELDKNETEIASLISGLKADDKKDCAIMDALGKMEDCDCPTGDAHIKICDCEAVVEEVVEKRDNYQLQGGLFQWAENLLEG
jgi:hypothetical protein